MANFIGQPLISHAAKLRPGFSQSQRLAVVGKYNAPLNDVLEQNHWTLVRNDAYKNGQSTSLIEGVRRAETLGATSVIISLADMPFIKTKHILRVEEALDKYDAVISSNKNVLMPPCGFRSVLFDRLTQLTGDRGAKAVFRTASSKTALPISDRASIDIDTQSDLANADKEVRLHG